jgi:hypothetical protein
MSINIENVKYVSGPVASVYLEGTIGLKKKKILLLGDWHYNMEDQTECENYNSINIKQYLINLFKKSNKDIDFFLEISKSMYPDYDKSKKTYTDIYLNNLRNFFYKETKHSKFKNTRFHYSDIRDIIYSDLYNFIINNKFLESITKSRDIFVDKIEFFIEKANIISECVNIIIIALKSKKENFVNYINQTKNENMKYYMKNIQKIVFEYNNEQVQSEIRDLLKKIIIGIKESMQKIINQLYKINKRIKKGDGYSFYEKDKVIYKLTTDLRYSTEKVSGFYAILTDLYTIRRFLDKKYINNIIFYGGGQHLTSILNILVNNFDFSVINKNSNDLNLINIDKNYIKEYYKKYNYDSYKESKYIIHTQCSDLSKITKYFI